MYKHRFDERGLSQSEDDYNDAGTTTNDRVEDEAVDSVAAPETLARIANKNIALHMFEGLDHYLVTEAEAQSGAETEQYHMDPTASAFIVKWIKEN